ncbi:MAG: MFS transporter [Polyangiaceae bacterium]
MKSLTESRLLLLLGAVQFVNVLDFMMVMPLGPDFAGALAIPVSHLGWIGGSYTAAAAAAGLIGSTFLDRFDRRSVLGLSLLGLSLGTLAGGFALGLKSLMAARVLAGAFGGPATSVALAIIADNIPVQRRGHALGIVMGAFSVASVLGVPAGLELARRGNFRTPFFAVSALCLLITLCSYWVLPPQRLHLDGPKASKPARPLGAFFADRAVSLSLANSGLSMFASFVLIPNLSTFFQHNLGYPRDQLSSLYFVGGILSFVAMRAAGAWVDRRGAGLTVGVGTALYAVNLVAGFFVTPPLIPVLVTFVVFMLASSLRNVSTSSIATRVPPPAERARFMSMQAAVQHIAASLGAILSSLLLSESPSGALLGIRNVTLLSLTAALAMPFLMRALVRQVRAREAAR